jgi:hypothetical protein
VCALEGGEEWGGRRAGEEGGGKLCGRQRGSRPEAGVVRVGLHSPPRVPVAGGIPGPLADSVGPGTARWPASGMQALPPLALGGMGGGALIQ